MIDMMILMVSGAQMDVWISDTGVLAVEMCARHQQEPLSVLTHQLSVEMQLTGGSITSPVTGTIGDWWLLLVPDVLQTTNNVSSPGTDCIDLALTITLPARTSQTKSSPSTPPADSITNSSKESRF